tara:strand:- start:15159 stop:16355 length:1197 start_codon:yes stop_codon:yes gene_type:complete
MGIKNLKKFLQNYNVFAKKKLSNYSNKILAFDLMPLFYKAIYSKSGYTTYFINLILRLKKYKIIPIFVFDGVPFEEKSKTLQKRKNIKEKANNKLSKLKSFKSAIDNVLAEFSNMNTYGNISNLDDVNYLKKDTSNNTENIEDLINIQDELIQLENYQVIIQEEYSRIQENIERQISTQSKKVKSINILEIKKLKELFNKFNIKYIHIGVEADVVCRYLVEYDIAYAAVSDDMDLIPFGCQRTIQNFNMSTDEVYEIIYQNVLDKLSLTSEQFTDFIICIGNDYNCRLINGSIDFYYRLIKIYHNIENIIKYLIVINLTYKSYIKIPSDFEFQKSRKIFNYYIEFHEIVSSIKNKKNRIISYYSEDYYKLFKYLTNIYDKSVTEKSLIVKLKILLNSK